MFHPWIYLFFMPAISMRLWAEERKSGSIELLLTLPVSMWEAVLGKFLAAWCFTAITLLLTTPVWITVNYLGNPDNGVILASYIGSLALAGGYLAIGACISALTRNQVVAFVISVCVCLAFVLAGYPVVVGLFKTWAPDALVEAVASIGFLTHYEGITKGIIEGSDVVFFVSLIALWLFANAVAIDINKAD
jgi:ABC-2 type transport system permease protein